MATCVILLLFLVQVSQGGLDQMFQRMILEALTMARDNATDINLNSTHLDYMFQASSDLYIWPSLISAHWTLHESA